MRRFLRDIAAGTIPALAGAGAVAAVLAMEGVLPWWPVAILFGAAVLGAWGTR